MKKSKKEEAILSELSQRFLSAISELGISGYKLSKEIPEITESKLTHIRNGRNEPSKQMLELFTNKYPQVNKAWLIAGVDEDNKNDSEIKDLRKELKALKKELKEQERSYDILLEGWKAKYEEVVNELNEYKAKYGKKQSA